MEKVNLDNEFVRHFLAESLSFEDIVNVITGRELEISLTVNGFSIPFIQSLEKIYKLFFTDVDKKAAEKILEKNTEQLRQLQEVIETCKNQLKSKLEELFDTNLD